MIMFCIWKERFEVTPPLSWYSQVALFSGLACVKPGLDLNSTGTGLGLGLDTTKVVLLTGLVCVHANTHTHTDTPLFQCQKKNTSVDK